MDPLDLYPYVMLSNGLVDTSVFLPKPGKGFYRGTRYEWSGMIWQLTYRGHTFFMPRHDQQPHDPTHPDHGMSLAEEFRMGSRTSFSSAAHYQGFYETRPGEKFVIIGVGRLLSPKSDKPYDKAGPYSVVDPGQWTVSRGKEWVAFVHELSDPSGYRYKYVKRMSLTPNRPELVVSHCLENLGTQIIDAFQYCHHFFAIDNDTIGTDYEMTLFFPAKFKNDRRSILRIDGNRIRFRRNLTKPMGSYVEGFDNSIGENRCIITNSRTNAGVEISGDHPVEGFFFYADQSAICPEMMLDIHLKPKQAQRWQRNYRFFAPLLL